jgi:glycine/D-amino acid oxidase-like deaminating enzyme
MGSAFDAIVIGGGIVGASCAHRLTDAGASVAVLDRGWVGGGSSGSGEGNILVSDKEPGPELELAQLSNRLWRDLAGEIDRGIELESKGGLVVAATAEALDALLGFARRQGVAGVEAVEIAPTDLPELEPEISRDLTGGVLYPQDMQVNPMLATACLLAHATRAGAELATDCEVTAIARHGDGRVAGVQTSRGSFRAPLVINAAGIAGAAVAALAGVTVPILPRRGFILVTEPITQSIRHKVYTADYVTNVASSDEGLQTSTVVESTASGTVLIGATRERVGTDRSVSWPALGRIAGGAISLFPFLAETRAMRSYCGFRPYSPDHLPVLGADPRVPGLIHACGHEGAGIGLAAATGLLVAQVATGHEPEISLDAFAPARFEQLGFDA